MTNVDRVLAFLAFAVFVGFVAIVGFKVARIDLTIVILLTVALVAYDCWTQLFRRRG